MRIESNQMIAGFPATAIRQLMRETLGRQITVRWVKEVLHCSAVTGNLVLTELQRDGYVTSAVGHLEPSLKGSALAQATAAKPLRRNSAERLVTELVDRAERVNACDDWAYRVKLLVVFGSFVGGAERPNDVDVAYRLSCRWEGKKQADAEQGRRDLFNGQFRSFVHSQFWPRLEIVRFLKSRSRGLSIQELEQWILKLENHRVIFQDSIFQSKNDPEMKF